MKGCFFINSPIGLVFGASSVVSKITFSYYVVTSFLCSFSSHNSENCGTSKRNAFQAPCYKSVLLKSVSIVGDASVNMGS